MSTMDAAIQLENISKHFRKGGRTIRALDGVSLTVPKGALALLRGPSGCGKTTLINLAAGLARPTSGSLIVEGKKLETLSGAERNALRAQHIAVVFQMFHLVPYLSARENVLLTTLARGGAGTDWAARADGLLEQLQISDRAHHFPAELSAGERQRCALARALLNDPSVILADEPTGNLDEESAQLVLDMLNSCREKGTTVLLVSHVHVENVHPDVEYRMKAGKLVEEAS